MADQQTQVQQATGEPFVRVEVDEARRLIDQGTVRVIDVREPREWEEGRIAGSKLVPLNEFFLDPNQHVPDDGVLFVCSVGVRSAIACEMAAAVGRQRIYNLEGGLTAWSARGYPTER